MKVAFLLFFYICTSFLIVLGQTIPSDRILLNSELSKYIKDSILSDLENKNTLSEENLAQYFRQKFTERYFFDWQTVEQRFDKYKELYPESQAYHSTRALDHITKYPSKPNWKLPFNYQNGEAVNAYALRHLARQHKMVDIGYYYFYQNKDEKYLKYFTDQLSSLNTAFSNNQFETIKDGNGVYEAFRSGYRVLNWLQLHNLFLSQSGYSDQDQLRTIATLLHHAQHLYEHNLEFKSGNHQTRGLSALTMLSILFRDFKGADEWYNHAMNLLGEHLNKEINEDGFQFERTVHYHISDIGNYFFVYQLAKKSNLPIHPLWENKLESLFTTLTKIAFPDKSAPVLSDDTDTPWAEQNNVSEALTLGYILFDNPEMGYFAENELSSKFYWYASEEQLKKLQNIQAKQPIYKSLSFLDTGYFIMRQGWDLKDKMMVVSAGLDDKKPDHQHGDMLGIQAMAHGQIILPNYQVRYSLNDLELFKNSMTKNVALVDNVLQGNQYTSNKGGSGFGKFKSLPKPNVIAFETHDDMDIFVGTHNGFENIGVSYMRQVINVNDDFWIVKDNFSSPNQHDYKQVWQGHYSYENGVNLLRSSFVNGSGLDIFQLNAIDKVKSNGARGKQWTVSTKMNEKDFQFITILYPFDTYSERIAEDLKNKVWKGWEVNTSKWQTDNPNTIALSKNETSILFNVKKLKYEDTIIEFNERVDLWLKDKDQVFQMCILNNKEGLVKVSKNGTTKTLNYTLGKRFQY